jgi:hypothetical protein
MKMVWPLAEARWVGWTQGSAKMESKQATRCSQKEAKG